MNKGKIAAGYLKRRGRYYVFWVLMCAFFNFYFLFLMQDRHVKYLLYLDFLLLLSAVCFAGIDLYRFAGLEAKRDAAEHDARALQEKLQETFDENCELQDYVAKCCHELKVPLAASLLLDERIEDAALGKDMREQLERLNRQLNSMLLGCKLQSTLFDIQVKPISLRECVRTSIRNNRFFLIQKGFEMDVRVEEVTVYTDLSWMVYILDQLLDNAVKYADVDPKLCIYTETEGKSVSLYVEDHGEGIGDSDLGRIFEKGYTGSCHHNGKYRSTGMGLYFVDKIASRLEHEITVESEWGKYTRFKIVMMQAVL